MADVLETISTTEQFLMFAVIVGGLYWFFTSCATKSIRCTLIPKGNSLVPNPSPGSEVQTSNPEMATVGTTVAGVSYSVTPSGTITATDPASGSPYTYGPSSMVPGTGLSVTDLRNSGLSNQDIANLIVDGQNIQTCGQ